MPLESSMPPEDMIYPPKPETRSSFENIGKVIGAAQSAITFALALGALLTATGFVIVNAQLSTFTDIHGYSIQSSQFLSAGVGLLIFITLINIFIYIIFINSLVLRVVIIFIFLYILINIFLTFGDAGESLISVIAVLISGLATLLQSTKLFKGDFVYEIILTPMQRLLKSISKDPLKASRIVIFTLYVLVLGILYGASFYRIIPRFLGGGRPESIILVFNDSTTLSQIGLAKDPIYPNRTQIVLLLADLNDGMLILDRLSGQVVAIKNDSVLAVYDDKVNQEYLVTPTPKPTLSPTATPIPTISITFTPVTTLTNP